MGGTRSEKVRKAVIKLLTARCRIPLIEAHVEQVEEVVKQVKKEVEQVEEAIGYVRKEVDESLKLLDEEDSEQGEG